MTTLIKAATSAGQSMILNVSEPSIGSIGSDIPIIFKTVDNTSELSSYTANYNTSTGIYTVPASGHKNIKIKARNTMGTSSNSNSIAIVINGSVVKRFIAQGSYSYLEIEHDLKGLLAGAQVQIKATCLTSNSINGTTTDGFQIFATS